MVCRMYNSNRVFGDRAVSEAVVYLDSETESSWSFKRAELSPKMLKAACVDFKANVGAKASK